MPDEKPRPPITGDPDQPITMADLDVWGSLENVPFPLSDPRLHDATRKRQAEIAAAKPAQIGATAESERAAPD